MGRQVGATRRNGDPQALVNDSYGWPQLPSRTSVGVVDTFTKGDQVMGKAAPDHGTYAEHAVLLASSCIAKPPQLSFAAAAVVPVAGATAWEAP